ncbi:MAG: tRNA lysidine(34) synthetase TilS [Burkholderiaceae bacterium]|jgi:tRNA(Ile)-lysidine synthase|nr:tRNA lysidine(34) synthetase TilS [Burkholderiaceae bacterium]
MGASPTPKLTHVNLAPPSLAHFSPSLPFAVALSGGADSCALLLACAKQWPGQVRAIHVHHGLQTAADAFASHCQTLCELLGVPLVVTRVNAHHVSGESPEDAARQARYQAFAQVLKTNWGGTIQDIALAQHADDQVETVLLALSRGAGLPGLSAMPAVAERGGLRIHRPWLDVPAQQLRDWLVQERVSWVEDPTNQDERYTRNRIRHQLLPILEEAFPSFRQTFGRSARHAAQAQLVLDDMALIDLQLIGVPPQLAALQQLSVARQANVLRAWLLQRKVACSTAQLDQLLHQIDACRTRGHQIDIKVGDGFVRRVSGHIDWYNF